MIIGTNPNITTMNMGFAISINQGHIDGIH